MGDDRERVAKPPPAGETRIESLGAGLRRTDPEGDVSDHDRIAIDQHGLKRQVSAGDPLPLGWEVEHVEAEPKKPAKRQAPKG